VVRTFAPMVAGIAGMRYRRFVFYNIAGGILWIVSVTLVGYFFGQIPFVQRHLEKIILGAIAAHAVLVPTVIALMKRFRGPKTA
jgi:membrane-associated protein